MLKRAVGILLAVLFVCKAGAQIFLPGMQPEEAGIEFAKVQQCKMCHSNTKNGPNDPFFSWQGSMMAQAGRDPLFRATLTIANQDVPGVGEFCFRCHTPRGWLEGRSEPADGSALNKEDMYGVSCDVCHRLIDPLSDEARKLVKDVPPGYGNAMMVADPENTVRGPYGDGEGAMPHGTMKSEYHASSSLCATCHNISNPTLAKDVRTQPPHAFGHIERTYSEWVLSDFAKEGQKGTCQSCHYKTVEGGGQASKFGSLHRSHFVGHGPVGGSTWIQDVTWLLWDGEDMDKEALDAAKERARKLLKTAASLSLKFPKPNRAVLRITNLTGHKLPSGYPEGRRMWVNVKFYNSSGKILEEIGKYGPKKDSVLGRDVTVPTVLDPDKTRVYEILMAMSETQAKAFGKKPGKSFFFVLNDIVAKDNRIPPRGFNNNAFAEHLSAPVGAEYADGQHWDDLTLKIPTGCSRIEANLMYQSTSWEYIKFLTEENKTDDWGKRLYDAWNKTGQCPPVAIASVESAVTSK
ncbi:MAG: multiheme c-type cytochrome [Planctomycetota bacterium]